MFARVAAAAATLALSVLGMGQQTRAAAPEELAKPGISLLSQTPYIVTQGTFRMRLAVSVGATSGDYLQVLGFPALLDRTNFDESLRGEYAGAAIYQPTVPVSQLTADPAGGYDVDIPFNLAEPPAPAGSELPAFPSGYIGGSAVYPLQVGLFDPANQMVGTAIDTFVVYAFAPASQSSFPALSVAVVLPITSPPVIGRNGAIGAPSTSESRRLSGLVSALETATSTKEVVNLQLTPQVLDALASGSPTDLTTLEGIRRMVSRGDEAFPATYVRHSISDFEISGLDSELDAQLATGAGVFKANFGQSAPLSPWAVNGPLDDVTLDALASRGATQLVVPDADLTALPLADTFNTFAYGTPLVSPGQSNLSVYGADTGLTADFDRASSPVLAANQLLAEMAMIQLEQPGLARGVVAMPPTGWTPSDLFVSTLLKGLDGDPLLKAVPASQLFKSGLIKDIPRSLAVHEPAALTDVGGSLSNDASSIQTARNQAAGLSVILPAGEALTASFADEILDAESSDVTEAQRRLVLDAINNTTVKITRQIVLPGPTSITLTSTKSSIPLTILSSPSLKATVRLELTSERLVFQNFSFPHGSCRVEDTTTEVCDIQLLSENNTIKVPVQSRSPGVFPLTVWLSSPDGSLTLGRVEHDTVRSTAISDVGIVLIVLTLLSLAVWWVRDLRHGRRARRLVPPPDGDPDGTTVTADPVIDAFFSPPPDGGLTDVSDEGVTGVP